jgi:hypothetical protein
MAISNTARAVCVLQEKEFVNDAGIHFFMVVTTADGIFLGTLNRAACGRKMKQTLHPTAIPQG